MLVGEDFLKEYEFWFYTVSDDVDVGACLDMGTGTYLVCKNPAATADQAAQSAVPPCGAAGHDTLYYMHAEKRKI